MKLRRHADPYHGRYHGACYCGWTGLFDTEAEMKQALFDKDGHLHDLRLEELAYQMDPEMSLQAWLRRQFRAEAKAGR